MAGPYANFAVSTVATAPSPATSGISLVVASGEGARFPTPPFNAVICPANANPDPTNAEIVRVTAIATDTFTISRGAGITSEDGGLTRSVVVGDRIYAALTVATFMGAMRVGRVAIASSRDVADADLNACLDINVTGAITLTIKEVASGGPNPLAAGQWFEVRNSHATGAKTVACTGAAVIRDPITGTSITSVVVNFNETLRFTEAGNDVWFMTGRDDPDLLAIANLTSAANKIPYYTGAAAAALLTLDIDGALVANSDTTLASQKATKTYADLKLAKASNLSDLASAATARTNLNVVRALFDHFADVGNITTGEDDLYSDTLAAGQLVTNGDKLTLSYSGLTAAHASNTRTIKLYFGGTMVFASAASITATSNLWKLDAEVVRVSASVVRVGTTYIRGVAATAGVCFAGWTEVTGLTLANTQIIKITGEGTSTNDIVAKQGKIVYEPAA